MGVLQESAKKFKDLSDTTSYIFHVSKNKKIEVFSVDFQLGDYHHIAGLQYLSDVAIPRNKTGVISWIINKKVKDEYIEKSKFYKGKVNDEKDIEKRISELRFLEDYLDNENIVYIYSPKDSPCNNSLIRCDYIIKSYLECRKETVFIFLKHRTDSTSPCRIISFGVKKKVEYGGIYTYVMLKDKVVNGERKTIFRHPKYLDEQKEINELNYLY